MDNLVRFVKVLIRRPLKCQKNQRKHEFSNFICSQDNGMSGLQWDTLYRVVNVYSKRISICPISFDSRFKDGLDGLKPRFSTAKLRHYVTKY